MSEAFVEYVDVTVRDGLRQGDVLESTDTKAGILERHLVVITADCDLANAKHGGIVTCVPVLDADDYLLHFRFPRIEEREERRLLDALSAAVLSGTGKQPTTQRLRSWVKESDADEGDLASGAPEELAGKITSLAKQLRVLGQPVEKLADAVEKISKTRSTGNVTGSGKVKTNDVRAEITSTYTNAPGDALFLGAIAPGADQGFFAYLRVVRQLQEHDIALSSRREPALYRRISRLRETYIHALAQRFALVFMSIGLPTEYEESRALYAQIMMEHLE